MITTQSYCTGCISRVCGRRILDDFGIDIVSLCHLITRQAQPCSTTSKRNSTPYNSLFCPTMSYLMGNWSVVLWMGSVEVFMSTMAWFYIYWSWCYARWLVRGCNRSSTQISSNNQYTMIMSLVDQNSRDHVMWIGVIRRYLRLVDLQSSKFVSRISNHWLSIVRGLVWLAQIKCLNTRDNQNTFSKHRDE